MRILEVLTCLIVLNEAKYIPLAVDLQAAGSLTKKVAESGREEIVIVYEGPDEYGERVVDSIYREFPQSRFGLVVFGGNRSYEDPCGYASLNKLTSDLKELKNFFGSIGGAASSSGNGPQNNFRALIKASRYPWSKKSRRTVVQVTSSPPRYYDDGGFEASQLDPPSTMEAMCAHEYFPTAYQTKGSLLQVGASLITLIADTRQLFGPAGQAFIAFNEFLGQKEGMVNAVAPDYSDVGPKLRSAVGTSSAAQRILREVRIYDGGLRVQFEGSPENFDIEVHEREQAKEKRLLQAVDIEEGNALRVRVNGGRPDVFSVKYNGRELAN